ncbi:MAG: hypothetical protein GEU90_22380, partial [Gemmatimonas sp.]|nr:hypothetical protein [Gemmatimonas sp.]
TGCAGFGAGPSLPAPEQPELARQVEIRRTTFGVPQILAENLRAAAFALAYVQLEDYGMRVISGMQAARGRMAEVQGTGGVAADARNRRRHARAAETFHLLQEDTREAYAGFAAGVNHFIRQHPDELADWVRPDFTAIDLLARDITWPSDEAIDAFRRRIIADPADPVVLVETGGVWQRAPRSGLASPARCP